MPATDEERAGDKPGEPRARSYELPDNPPPADEAATPAEPRARSFDLPETPSRIDEATTRTKPRPPSPSTDGHAGARPAQQPAAAAASTQADGQAPQAGAQQQEEIEVPERPKLAPNITPKGEMTESAFENPPWLLEREGGYIQVTKLLYHVAEQANGERTLEEIATAMSEKIGRKVSADNVRTLAAKLIAMGIVQNADGSNVKSAAKGESAERSPLAVRMKMAMVDRRYIVPLTTAMKFLYWPPVLLVLVAIAAAAQGWLYFVHGVGGGIHDALYQPGLLLVVLVIVIIATAFHEFGHAAALEYGGGKVGGMGAGIYIVYPAFYTDVTDNYRLPRWGRVRTDLGGIYFTAIFAVVLMVIYVLTGWEFLLAAVLFLNFETIHNLLPFVRLDGYWTLADITGIPDFFSQIVPFLRSILPEWVPLPEGRKLPALKTWAKWVFALYILITIPLLLFLLFLMVQSVPRLLATFWDALKQQTTTFSQAMDGGDVLGMVAAGIQAILLALPTLGLLYTLYSLGKRAAVAVWNWSKPTPTRRVIGTLGSAAAVALIAYLWLPGLPFGRGDQAEAPRRASRWVPIGEDERFAIADVAGGDVVTQTRPFRPLLAPIREDASTPTATRTPEPTSTREERPSRTATPRGTRTGAEAGASETETAEARPTRSPTVARTPSRTAAATRTATREVTQTATRAPTRTATVARTPTSTRAPTRTATAERTPSSTRAPTRTATREPSPSNTRAPTRTPTPEQTPTRAPTRTNTREPAASATRTRTPVPTVAPPPTWTPGTAATRTPVPTIAASPTRAPSSTPVTAATNTRVPTPPSSPTAAASTTPTPGTGLAPATPGAELTASSTPTATGTATASTTATATAAAGAAADSGATATASATPTSTATPGATTTPGATP